MDLYNDLDKILALVKKHATKILILDFDGTLAPIRTHPQKANITIKTRNLLQKLSKKRGFYIAILSGRKLQDLKAKIKLPNIIYAGNHGIETEIYGKIYTFPISNKIQSSISEIAKKLGKIIAKFDKAFIEDKGSVLALHYRLVHKRNIHKLLIRFDKIIKPYIKNSAVSVTPGKMVYDICPNINWHKGDFAKFVVKMHTTLSKTKPLVIFIGDDKSDENVFEKLKGAICIKVGTCISSTKAKYSLKDTKEVYKFLNLIGGTSNHG